MGHPRIGMNYEDVRKRVNRISKTKVANPEAGLRLMGSLINQARLANGEDAAHELTTELTFSGSSNRQVGIGEGKYLGGGRWRWTNDLGWHKIE
jgi:hypothetical protein